MKKIYLIAAMFFALLISTSSLIAQSQDWVTLMQNPNSNFYDVQKAFNIYYTAKKAEMEQNKVGKNDNDEQGENEENEVPGFSQYKRWEWFHQSRMGPNGEAMDPSACWRAMEQYNKIYPPQTQAGAWTFVGPNNTSTLSGAGRCTFVKQHPTIPTTLFFGSPSGGLWVSTNSGTTWTTNTDNLPQVIGCTDVAFDPTNPNIMYMATGDGDAGDNYAVGVLKSLDGGVTWATTGLSFGMGQSKQINTRTATDANNINSK